MMDSLLDNCLSSFGEEVTYYPSGGGSEEIYGIFDENFLAVDADTGLEVQSLQPNLNIKLSDLASLPAKGDEVEVRNTRYRVLQSQKDSEGGAVLILQEAE